MVWAPLLSKGRGTSSLWKQVSLNPRHKKPIYKPILVVVVNTSPVYSLLDSLERDKMIKARIEKTKGIHMLTKKGGKAVKTIRNENSEFQNIIKDLPQSK